MIFFISAMLHRTEAMRDKNKETWNHILKCMDEVREIARQPMNLFIAGIEVTAEILEKMNAHFLYLEDSNPGFITSDNPCLCLNPLNPGFYSGLGSPSIELTFPISPKLLAIFFWGDPQHCGQRWQAFVMLKSKPSTDTKHVFS